MYVYRQDSFFHLVWDVYKVLFLHLKLHQTNYKIIYLTIKYIREIFQYNYNW